MTTLIHSVALHRNNFSIVVGATALAGVLAPAPAAGAAVTVVAPKTVPAGQAGVARVDAGTGNRTCSLTVRHGKVEQGPFRSTAKPVALFTWTVPANARKGRWTLVFRCAKNARGLAKAKAKTAAMSVTTTKSGGVRRLIKPGSVRTAYLRTFDFIGTPPGTECAAAWNSYKSVRDETGYCTGYDTWYAYKRLGLPQFKGLGDHTSEWHMGAQLKKLTVSTAPIVKSIAWWRGTADEPTRVAFVEFVGGTSITVKEMNRTRWNVATTRSIPLNAKTSPDAYFALPPQTIDSGTISVPPPLAPLPTVLGAPAKGAGRTAEIISAVHPIDGVDRVSYSQLGYGTDNVFRAALVNPLQGMVSPGKWLFTGDVDGDGDADLITTQAASTGGPAYYVVARSNGDGTFALPVATPPQLPQFPTGAAVLDANRDGKADILTIEDGPTYVVALANGDGTFTRTAPVATPDYEQNLVVGDFTGDSVPDVLAGTRILVSNGDGTFTSGPATGVPVGAARLAAGDVNGDGRADLFSLATTNGGSGPWAYTLSINAGAGFFVPQPEVLASAASQLASGDVNGDGHVDFVTSSPEGVTYVAYLGAGDGTFTRTELAQGVAPSRLAVGDIDGR